ncbi:hypothetical protein SDC9_124959 [bioreactor metagenome]|uniref:Uncharacterized protein n=1 Tax=bioreactor metagenome TaxID=1076179 RepID=A0A645CM38_9ZZZZ
MPCRRRSVRPPPRSPRTAWPGRSTRRPGSPSSLPRTTCASALRCCPAPTSPSARCSRTSSWSPRPPAARRSSPRRWPTPRRVRRGRRRTTSARCTRCSTGPPIRRWPRCRATRCSRSAAPWSIRPSCWWARSPTSADRSSRPRTWLSSSPTPTVPATSRRTRALRTCCRPSG